MGKLDIWVRDESCKVVKTKYPGGDYIAVTPCGGKAEIHSFPSTGEAHMVIEVPPGCYILGGQICEMPEYNVAIQRTMVIVGFNQELCVNLVIPVVTTCVRDDLPVFIELARLARVPEQNLRIAAQVMLIAGKISPDAMAEVMQGRITTLKDAKGSPERIKEYQSTLDMIKGLKMTQ